RRSPETRTTQRIEVRRMRLLRRAAMLLAAFAALGAMLSASAAETRTFTDSAGRQVQVPKQVVRVFAAGPPAAVLLYTLAPGKLVGWPRELGADAKALLPARYAGLPVVGRLTGHEASAGAAAVAAAHPDLIVDVGDVEPEYSELADRIQAQSGVPYVLIDGSLAKTGATYRMLGDIVGEPARAAELADESDRLLADAQAASGGGQLRGYYGRGKDGLETGLGGSINVEFLAAAGVANVAAAAGDGELKKVTLDQVVGWNPDVIVTLDPAFFGALSTDSRWKGVNAVRDRHVYLAPNAPFGWIDSPPGVNRLLGVRWLAGQLYPQALPSDLRTLTRDFYARYYQVDLNDAQLDQLLDTATRKL